MKTTKFVRKPLYVEAVQVTTKNMIEVAGWCGGTYSEVGGANNKHGYIQVDVPRAAHQRQREAYVGDWVLKAGTGFKVYTNDAFNKSFYPAAVEERKRRPNKPTPPVKFNLDDSNRQGLPYPEKKPDGLTTAEWEALSLRQTQDRYKKAS